MASDLTRSLRAFMRSEVKNSKIYSTIYARPCIILKLQNSLVRLKKTDGGLSCVSLDEIAQNLADCW